MTSDTLTLDGIDYEYSAFAVRHGIMWHVTYGIKDCSENKLYVKKYERYAHWASRNHPYFCPSEESAVSMAKEWARRKIARIHEAKQAGEAIAA